MDFGGFAGGAAAAPELDRALYAMQEVEGQRYAAFFGTLEQAAPQRVARATALAFFGKSSLSDAEVESLYASVKSAGVLADPAVMNETEFVLAMHLIVCLTKRGLAGVPSPFPTYLFPSLALPTPSGSQSHGHADLISNMPSPEKPSGEGFGGGFGAVGRSSFSGMGGEGSGGGVSSAPTEIAKLEGSASLVDLAQKEVQNSQLVKTKLSQIDQSEVQTLQHLQATLAALAAAVAQLGFPVPPTAHASIGAVDDLGNLLRANVQSLKQEIQSLEISARMRSVADEATSRTNSRDGEAALSSSASPSEASAAIAQVATLSAQLAALQHEATQLQTKKDALARQLLDKKTAVASAASATPTPLKTVSGAASMSHPPMSTSSSTSSMGLTPPPSSWGDFSASPAAVAPFAPPQDAVRSSETTTPPADAFAFGAFGAFEAPTSAPAETTQPQDADFGWGAFQ